MVLRGNEQLGEGRRTNSTPRSVAVIVNLAAKSPSAVTIVVDGLGKLEHSVATVGKAGEVQDGRPPGCRSVRLLSPGAECAGISLAVRGDVGGEEWLACKDTVLGLEEIRIPVGIFVHVARIDTALPIIHKS